MRYRMLICVGWGRGGWGSRGDCRLPERFGLNGVLLRSERGSSSREGLSTSSASGGDRRLQAWGGGVALGGSPPQSFRTLLFLTACLWLSSVTSSPSFCCRKESEETVGRESF